MIVLNSDYLYTPTTNAIKRIGGGLHGYIMDNQLAWLEETVAKLEADDKIDHIFLTQHTPCFPNGGHVRDDMWYSGNNDMRPWIGGKALRNGIIQRRDQILDIIINKSNKVRAILTGDEHNYNRLKITNETSIYPEVFFLPKLEIKRPIFQINNGAAGAPYYAQEQTPWTPFVSSFTTQNALVFFNVQGDSIWVEVLNPDTLEVVDQFWLTGEK
jgi:3',5'-cyclic AMP phosphodiesterase CpdA